MESDEKLSNHSKSSLLYAHMVSSVCAGSMTKQLDLHFNLMISTKKNLFSNFRLNGFLHSVGLIQKFQLVGS